MALILEMKEADERTASVALHGPSCGDAFKFMDGLRFNRRHAFVFAVCALGMVFEAYDIQALALVAPLLRTEWNLSPVDVGRLFSVGGLGMLIGAYLFGTLADRIGRRAGFQLTVCLFAFGSLLSAFARTPAELAICRLIVGAGVGGFIPIDAALLSEFLPIKTRGMLMGFWAMFHAIGNALAAQLAAFVVPSCGWQAIFVIGAIPAVMGLFARRIVPESPRYLASVGKKKDALSSVEWISMGSSVPLRLSLATVCAERQAVSPKLLFDHSQRASTAFAFVLWFCLIFGYLGINTWMPSLLSGYRGFSQSEVFSFVSSFAVAGIFGRIFVAVAIDYVGRRVMITMAAFGAALCALFFGRQVGEVEIVMWGMALGFFVEGVTGAAATLSPELFPTHLRSTGIGWAQGLGRVAGMLAPIIVASLVVLGVEPVFWMFAAAYGAICGAALFLLRETNGRSLE
jgi:MFS transporter, putative metabolite:H+ symporter